MLLSNKIKYFILLYFIIVIITQIYYFDLDRYYYLKTKNFYGILFHLLYPIVKYKLPNNKGFYTLIFNFIVYETFIIEKFRGIGLGRELANYLIKKYYVFILNDININSYKRYLLKNKNNFISLFNKILIKID